MIFFWTLFLLRKSRSAVALFQAGLGPSAVAAKFVQRSAGSWYFLMYIVHERKLSTVHTGSEGTMFGHSSNWRWSWYCLDCRCLEGNARWSWKWKTACDTVDVLAMLQGCTACFKNCTCQISYGFLVRFVAYSTFGSADKELNTRHPLWRIGMTSSSMAELLQ